MTSAKVHLYFGVSPMPAARIIAEAFEALTVTQSDSGLASGWQIVLRAQRKQSRPDDYELLSNPMLRPFTRVVAAVSMGSEHRVLLDGVITHIELSPPQQGKEALLTITGDSIDTVMDLVDFPIPWPALTDGAIVEAVLLKYLPLGLIPEVTFPMPPPEPPDPLERTIVQNETDAAFLRRLACPYGYVFYVKPGPAVGTNTAHWGPPPRTGMPQKALSVDLGSATNVNGLSFAYDAKGPTLVFGMVQSEYIEGAVPIATTEPVRLPPLARNPAILSLVPFVGARQYANPAYEFGRAMYEANAITQRSTDRVVTATGSVDTLRYGHILDVPGVVGVRGAGSTYDGNYYINSVTHTIRLGSYTQDFALSREGTGTTTAKVIP